MIPAPQRVDYCLLARLRETAEGPLRSSGVPTGVPLAGGIEERVKREKSPFSQHF
jgi:hypothetical protein